MIINKTEKILRKCASECRQGRCDDCNYKLEAVPNCMMHKLLKEIGYRQECLYYPVKENGKELCPVCLHIVAKKHKYCPNCGTKITRSE